MRLDVYQALRESGLSERSQRNIREWAAARFTSGPLSARDLDDLRSLIARTKDTESGERGDAIRSLLDRLDAAFFGPFIQRDPEAGIARPRHGANAWRNGVSHPFRATVSEAVLQDDLPEHRMLLRIAGVTAPGVATFDVLEDPVWTRHQYTMLRIKILAGQITAA